MSKIKMLIYAAMMLAIVMVALEIIIRLTGFYHTQSEKGSGNFINPFESENRGWHYAHQPCLKGLLATPEFSYYHQYDSLGFRNDSMKTSYDAIAFGDSFTEGLGAPQDSTWPALYSIFSGNSVYNAGAMGSDPAYNYMSLRQLLFLQPKYILFSVNFSDIYDVNFRGGMERFKANGSVRYADPPWYLPAYEHSHLFRAFLHLGLRYDFMFIPPINRDADILKNILIIKKIFLIIRDLCEKEQIGLYVFISPVPQEYYKNLDRRVDFKAIDTLAVMLAKEGIQAWNLRPGYEAALKSKESWAKASWARDGHFNGKGYALKANLIYEKLRHAPVLNELIQE